MPVDDALNRQLKQEHFGRVQAGVIMSGHPAGRRRRYVSAPEDTNISAVRSHNLMTAGSTRSLPPNVVTACSKYDIFSHILHLPISRDRSGIRSCLNFVQPNKVGFVFLHDTQSIYVPLLQRSNAYQCIDRLRRYAKN